MSDKNTWEEIYKQGNQLNRYPYDSVVTFIYRNYPRNIKKKSVNILEVGCGAGNNLWFAAREGFNVTGIDISKSAIDYVKERFKQENLDGKFIVSNSAKLPFEENTFDLVIDRAALTYLDFNGCKTAVNEINRVLKSEGKFFFNPFSEKHSSCVSGEYMKNGITFDIKVGIAGCGETCFYGRRDIYNLFDKKWKIESVQHTETTEQINPNYFVYADWKIIVRKVNGKDE
ncbi:class I SAM-dependent methyltransferase [Clostridium sp. ZBS13]|uniref:class I SAM-dependent methyltransferase n=1 Tax=Clostridium sp. ZBS13 TaxID=2949971 RepID=UPI00207A60F1|nr:class I SAM-dependent methyltransferase [Clostridium sp. ZBS13]